MSVSGHFLLRKRRRIEDEIRGRSKDHCKTGWRRKNINNLVHCATRLRFELKNEAKADKEALESLPYVMKVIASGGQYQVVIGPDVNNYYNAILSIANIGNKKIIKKKPAKEESN